MIEVIEQSVNQISIPEHLKPKLKRKSKLATVANREDRSSQELSSNEQVELQLTIDRTYDREIGIKQFREQVREYLQDHRLADHEKDLLDILREELGLSAAEADRIIKAEQEPILQAQQAYRKRLEALIKYYPFNEAIGMELKKFQIQKNLTDEEVNEVSQPILEQAEGAYQGKLRQQEYESRLQRYEQEFRRAIEAQYPIDASVRDELRKFQQSLGLSDEEVARIEEPIAAPKELDYQQRLAQQRELERQQEQERQRELRRQQQLEQERKREEARKKPPLSRFEFQVPQVKVGTQVIEKPGLFGKKTETVTTLNVTYQRGQAEYFTEDLGKGVTLEMVAIAGGTFLMGSTEYGGEQPQHRVTVQPFSMGKYAVTQAQWKAVAGMPKVKQDLNPDPSNFKGDRCPVEQVSWHEAVEFCDRLSQRTGRPYRLPSEAEWEYACRAGTTTPFYCGETITTDLANYDGNYTYGSGIKGDYRQQTIEVGSFPANAFGLHDMHGNVWEWCLDHWHYNYHDRYKAPIDGSAWITGGASDRRLLRGGSWNINPWGCRSAYRLRHAPVSRYNSFGFRVVGSAAWTP